MATNLQSTNIIQSFKTLTGNTRTSVVFEPLWGIPFSLYNFYLSLYMKSQGITDGQIGYLISIGFIFSIIFAIFGGMITDALGRKKTTLIFDFLAWPLSLMIYIISKSFWMFALATVINSLVRIVAISWNLMVVEDADSHQQVAAYNLINAINISVGVFTPIAGLLVRQLGIVTGERVLLGFAVVSMTVMILVRNYYYQETAVGMQILHEHRVSPERRKLKIDLRLFRVLKEKPIVLMVLSLSILFNTYIPIGTFYSLYYAPFLTEALKLDKSAIALLGGVNAFVMLLVFVLLIPLLSRYNRFVFMLGGVGAQIFSLILFITIPANNFMMAIIGVIVFALGFGMAKPFIDAILAEVTGGKDRAGIYSIYHTVTSILGAGVGLVSGYLYDLKPALIYIMSIGILLICMIFLSWLQVAKRKTAELH